MESVEYQVPRPKALRGSTRATRLNKLVLAKVAALVVAWCLSCTAAADDVVPIESQEISGGIYLLTGRGGNVALSSGNDGIFVIDDQYATQFTAITAAVAKISDAPIRFLFNTHWHNDHTGGNEQMGVAGATIVAHENVRKRLSTDQRIDFFNVDTPASARIALPIVTFSRDVTFHLNDDDIHVVHVNNAHTDGDAVVHFRQANIIHTGDVFFHERYPFIDSGSGGSMTGMIAAVDRILALADDDTRIIPGHGKLTDKRGLQRYREMLSTTYNAIAALIVTGNDVEQAVIAKPSAAFDPTWGNGFIKPDVYVRMVYNDIKQSTLQ